MIEVFQTDVYEPSQARDLVAWLHRHFPATKINIDLDDCDKVLRIEGKAINVRNVIELVMEKGFKCKLLE